MIPGWLLPALLGGAVLLGWARPLLWRRAAPSEARGGTSRLAALLLLQPVAALLLYLTLVPPSLPGRSGTLVLLTRDAARAPAEEGGATVALPEARAGAEVERAPDLATALRRHPGTRALVVRGEGLEPRDREAAAALPLTFLPAPPRAGLIRLDPPAPAAPGAAFRVAGAVAGDRVVAAELLDPAGRRVDAAALGKDGGFALLGTARDPGTASFTLRLLDAAAAEVERMGVPVRVVAAPPPKLLLLAGAPNAEVKALRRWASDAGVPMRAQVGTGGGVTLGDPPVAPTAATLRGFDAAIVDERSWAAAGAGGRAALLAAAREGLGLLLRIEGPPDAPTLAQWRGLGFALTGGGGAARLPREAIDAAALRATRGTGTRDVAAALNLEQNEAPPLTRAVALGRGAAMVPLIADAGGAPLAGWRALGQGRIGVWTLADSYALVLAGQRERHAELWSRTLAAIARPQGGGAPTVAAFPRAGQRIVLCGLAPGSVVTDPIGGRVVPLPDPAAGGCAGYWPARAGRHLLRSGDLAIPFEVLAADALPGLRAEETRAATRRLVRAGGGASDAAERREGSPWPWFLGWLAASGLLWWLERYRSRSATSSTANSA